MATPRDEYFEDPIIMYVIKSTAQRTADSLHLASYDENDAEQDLHYDLQVRLQKHDARRSNLRTFATRLIRNQAVTIIKRHQAEKRGPARKYRVSLDDVHDPDRGSRLLNNEVIAASSYSDWVMQRPTDIRDTDLAIDLGRALKDLPGQLRETAGALESACGVVAEAAAELGVHRSVVYDRRAAIRRRLESAGLGEYLTE